MSIFKMTAKSDTEVFNITSDNGGPTITGIDLDFSTTDAVLESRFTYAGNVNRSVFDKDTKILIKDYTVTIPNLIGIVPVIDPGESLGTFNLIAKPTPTGTPTGTLKLPIILGQTIELNNITSTPLAAEDFYLHFDDTTVRLDNRNLQDAYDGITVFLQIDLTVENPLAFVS